MECPLLGGRIAQTIHPPSKLAYKRHILGISTSPWYDFYRPKLCSLSNHPTQKIQLIGQFFFGGGLAKPPCRNSDISYGCMLHHTDSRLFFQTWSKLVMINFWKAALYWWQKKKQNTRIGAVWWNPWGDFLKKIFCASAHCGPTLLIHVSSKSVQVWGSYNGKTLWLPKWF